MLRLCVGLLIRFKLWTLRAVVEGCVWTRSPGEMLAQQEWCRVTKEVHYKWQHSLDWGERAWNLPATGGMAIWILFFYSIFSLFLLSLILQKVFFTRIFNFFPAATRLIQNFVEKSICLRIKFSNIPYTVMNYQKHLFSVTIWTGLYSTIYGHSWSTYLHFTFNTAKVSCGCSAISPPSEVLDL